MSSCPTFGVFLASPCWVLVNIWYSAGSRRFAVFFSCIADLDVWGKSNDSQVFWPLCACIYQFFTDCQTIVLSCSSCMHMHHLYTGILSNLAGLLQKEIVNTPVLYGYWVMLKRAHGNSKVVSWHGIFLMLMSWKNASCFGTWRWCMKA